MELEILIKEIKEISWVEWTAVSFGVAEVLLARANKVWLYPAGIISVLLSCYLFLTSGLYAESALNLYYLVMSIYGWWLWAFKRNGKPLPISKASSKEWKTVLIIIVLGFIILFGCLKYFTDSTVPVMDAWVSSTAWAGMFLLARRKIENWILLNISNAFAIPLLFYKELPLYGLLTLFLFVVAVLGYFDWKKILDKEKNDARN